MRDKRKLLAESSLLITAAIWGANFAIIKQTLAEVPPMLFLGVRFILAFLPLAPFMLSPQRRPASRDGWIKGVITGCLLFGGFATQVLGLEYTTPGISGFLTGTYVVLVPLLGIFIYRRFPGWGGIAGAALVALGLGVLSLRGHIGFGPGDVLTLLCAVFFALHFLALGRWSGSMDTIFLTGIQLLVTGVGSFAASLCFEHFSLHFSLMSWGAILYGAFLGSLGAYFIQTLAQRHTPPHHAAIILSTEAVFAAVFSVILGMEPLTAAKMIGFALIMGGILVSEFTVAV